MVSTGPRQFRHLTASGKDAYVMFDEGAVRHIRRHWAVFAGLAVALAVWGVVDVARRAIVDPQRPHLHMTDFTVYTEAGAAFFDGREPYNVTNIRGWKYLYPPLFALLVAPLAALSPPAQALIFFAVSVLLYLGSYFECRRLLSAMLTENGDSHLAGESPSDKECRSRGTNPGFQRQFVEILAIIAAGAALFPTLNCLQRGQIGVVLMYPLLLGFRLVVLGPGQRAAFAGGLCLSIPIVLKLTPALPVGCLLLALIAKAFRRRSMPVADGAIRPIERSPLSRALRVRLRAPDSRQVWFAGAGVVTGCLLFALLIPASLLGWQANVRHLETWYTRVASKADHDRTDQFAGAGSTIRNQSLTNAAQRFGNWAAYQFAGGPDDRLLDQAQLPELGTMPMDRPIVHALLLITRALAGLILLAAVIVLGRRGDAVSLGLTLGLGCMATLVLSPVARGHYFLLSAPTVLFGGLWIRQRRSDRMALRFASIPMLLSVIHYVALNQAGRIGLLGIGTAVWFFAACTIVVADAVRERHAGCGDDALPASPTRAISDRAAA